MSAVSCESIRAAVMTILEVWRLSEHLEEVLKMLGLPLSERPNGNKDRRLTPCQLRVSIMALEEQEAAKLGIVTPAYQIIKKGSSVIYLIWRDRDIPLAKRRDELENERKSSQVTLL